MTLRKLSIPFIDDDSTRRVVGGKSSFVLALFVCVSTANAGCFSPNHRIGMDDAGETEGTSDAGSSSQGDPSTNGGPTTDPDGGPGSVTAETDTGDPKCGQGSTCLPIPDGWNGPIAAIDGPGGGPTPGCGGEYGGLEFTGFGGFTAGTPECGCSCAEPEGVSCPATSTLNRYPDSMVSCDDQQASHTYDISEGCTQISAVSANWHLTVPLDLTGVSCNPNASSQVPPVAWATVVAGCGLTDPAGTCDAGLCVPELDDPAQRLCVWHEGETECSGSTFTERQVLYRDHEDDRACSECQCGSPEGSCPATVTFRAGSSCNLNTSASGTDGMCIPMHTNANSVNLAYDAPAASCEPSGGNAMGSAGPVDAITICCASE